MTGRRQNEDNDINESTVQRICQATALQLSPDVSLEDAVYQLKHLRDYYRYQVKHLPRMNSTELTKTTNMAIKGGRRLLDLLSDESHRLFHDAIRAAAIDRWGTQKEADKIIIEAYASLKALTDLADHLAAKKDEFNRSSSSVKIGWPLQGPGNRALFPFLRANSKTPTSPLNPARDLIDNYLPAIYALFFPGRAFTTAYDTASGTYTGPALRFAFSVFSELKLGEHRSDAGLKKQIAERIRSKKKKRTK